MWALIFLISILLASNSFAKEDSTNIKFKYLDRDLNIICELSDIQFIGLECTDVNMRGKKFLLSFDEYENGKIIKTDSSLLICKDEKISYVIGKDTVYEIFNFCDNMKFNNEDSAFNIRCAGKLMNDTFKLKINYAGVVIEKKFLCNDRYSLRKISCSSGDEVVIKLNTLTPILAYTPPFAGQEGSSSYCLLGTEKIESWFSKFKVKHYYIINIKIE